MSSKACSSQGALERASVLWKTCQRYWKRWCGLVNTFVVSSMTQAWNHSNLATSVGEWNFALILFVHLMILQL